MKKEIKLIILLSVIIFLTTFNIEAQENEINYKVQSIEQLEKLIISKIKSNDIEKIIDINLQLLLENESFMIQLCSTLIYKSIRTELSEVDNINSYGKSAMTLANSYLNNKRNDHLLNKAKLLLNLKKEDKIKYIDAEELFEYGKYYLENYQFDSAINKFNESKLKFQEINHEEGQAHVILGFGELYWLSDSYEKAIKYFNEALAIFKEINDCQGEANTLKYFGDVYMSLSDYEKAKSFYDEAKGIFQNIKDSLGEANCLRGLGESYCFLSNYEDALDNYRQALDIYKKIDVPLGEANTLNSLGDIYLRELNYDYIEAEKYYRKALSLYPIKIKDTLMVANSFKGLGEVYWLLNHKEIAENYYKIAIELQRKINDQAGLQLSYYGLGQIYEKVKDYQKAEEFYKKSIEIIETLWSDIKFERYKTDFLDAKMPPYEAIINLLFLQGRGKDAFEYAQRSKSRSFLYLIGNKKIDPRLECTAELLDEEKILRQDIFTTALTIRNSKYKKLNKKEIKSLNDKLKVLKKKHLDIIEKIKRSSPEYASFVSVDPLSIEQIQENIKSMKDTYLIEYYTTEKATYAWLLDGENIHPFLLDINRDNLRIKIDNFRKYLTDGGSSIEDLTDCAQELYDILFNKFAEYIKPNSRLGIIPHSSLHLLPFATLMDDDKFLIEKDLKIFYLPNATTLKYCRDKNSMKKENIIALATSSFVDEINCLKNYFPGECIESLPYQKATESAIIASAKNADILHFSCHGEFNEKDPMLSALVLEPDQQNDGRLEVHEIFDIQLKPAYLVTLSACQSDIGRITHSDEIVGMTRAFLHAGSSTVLSSLWDVNAFFTENLMKYFYEELRKNDKDKLDALHDACQTLIKETQQRHPYFWAPFVLNGDPQ